ISSNLGTGAASDWTFVSTTAGSLHMDGTGFFEYGFNCTKSSGNSCGDLTSLSFHINSVAGLTIGSFNDPNALGQLFAADISSGTAVPCGSNGCVPNTGAVDVSVPAPVVGAGLPGLIVACGGLIAMARRRRRRAHA